MLYYYYSTLEGNVAMTHTRLMIIIAICNRSVDKYQPKWNVEMPSNGILALITQHNINAWIYGSSMIRMREKFVFPCPLCLTSMPNFQFEDYSPLHSIGKVNGYTFLLWGGGLGDTDIIFILSLSLLALLGPVNLHSLRACNWTEFWNSTPCGTRIISA